MNKECLKPEKPFEVNEKLIIIHLIVSDEINFERIDVTFIEYGHLMRDTGGTNYELCFVKYPDNKTGYVHSDGLHRTIEEAVMTVWIRNVRFTMEQKRDLKQQLKQLDKDLELKKLRLRNLWSEYEEIPIIYYTY